MKNIRKFFLLAMGALLLPTCDDNKIESGDDDNQLTVGTTAVSELTATSAVFTASVTAIGNLSEKGFCYSAMNSTPDVSDNKLTSVGGKSNFSASATGLSPETVYYVRAYAKNAKGAIAYGATATFTTLSDQINPLDTYTAPDYADDYAAIASWSRRSQWNLANVHDPSVAKCGEYYYMYQTDASYGNAHAGHGHYPYRRSKDLVNWEFMGTAMNETPPAWVKDSLNSMRAAQGLAAITNPTYGFWAPEVAKVGDNKYRLYYSIVVDNYIATGKANTTANFDNSWTERAFIGLMETTDLASNNWEDKGIVTVSATDKGNNWNRVNQNNWDAYFKWNAIDPTFIEDKTGAQWLVYGSWHSGIVALQLDPATGKALNPIGTPWVTADLSTFGTLIYTRGSSSRWQGSEAPEIIYNPQTDYYYLFLAYDELSVAYNTRVLRSKNITGPWTGYNGNPATGGQAFPIITHPYKFNDHSGWVGISHCTAFQGTNDEWFFASQGRLPANTNGNAYSNAIMMGHVRKIRFTPDGWLVVMPERYANVPDVPITEDELTGTWEHIRLQYSAGNQATATTLNLHADKTTSGSLSGAWSWDADNKILTIGTQKLCVEREVDWEADPRKPTIVYAGLDSSGVSLWGKKK
ncbi:MAG: arabinan endo-1,5-alpha-L-arabinosidase [Candidatus Symbiothrix sp.]|jgi:arabinan endo-1,5-alpha-L-arabinosidase|nr:arabinan endo-1,5-alpha-L-arabinosidase [Candidatus Symbiothrix sp.]